MGRVSSDPSFLQETLIKRNKEYQEVVRPLYRELELRRAEFDQLQSDRSGYVQAREEHYMRRLGVSEPHYLPRKVRARIQMDYDAALTRARSAVVTARINLVNQSRSAREALETEMSTYFEKNQARIRALSQNGQARECSRNSSGYNHSDFDCFRANTSSFEYVYPEIERGQTGPESRIAYSGAVTMVRGSTPAFFGGGLDLQSIDVPSASELEFRLPYITSASTGMSSSADPTYREGRLVGAFPRPIQGSISDGLKGERASEYDDVFDQCQISELERVTDQTNNGVVLLIEAQSGTVSLMHKGSQIKYIQSSRKLLPSELERAR